MYKWITALCLFSLLCSCRSASQQNEVEEIISAWQHKEVFFPEQVVLTDENSFCPVRFADTARFRILAYVDSAGCTGCRLQLPLWKDFMSSLDSVPVSVSLLFFFNSASVRKIQYLLRHSDFKPSVYWDAEDSLNRLNHFPADFRFQTFLLDSCNRVLLVGNPIHNPLIKELYLKVIKGDTSSWGASPQTFVFVPVSSVDLGECRVEERQTTEFFLKNQGQHPLLIQDVAVSCGCLSVVYERRPVKSGELLKIVVNIKPENRGYFEKTVSVYGNMKESPVRLYLKGWAGNAE